LPAVYALNAGARSQFDLIFSHWLIRIATQIMGKGYDKNQARLTDLSLLGKDLARRAKSTCELSGVSGVPLRIYEVPPAPKDPDADRCLFLSDAVLDGLKKPSTLKAEEWRHLTELIWTDLPMVQLMTVRLLQYFAPNAPWCQEVLDEAYLEEEVFAAAARRVIGD
jgi:protein PhnA